MPAAFETLLIELTEALRPLVYAAEEDPVGSGLTQLALETGYDLGGLLSEQSAAEFVTAVSTAHGALRTLVSDPAGFVEQLPEVVEQVGKLSDELETLNELLPAGADLAARLVDYLVATYVERRSPTLYALLALFGIVRETAMPAAGTVPAYVRREIRWNEIPRLTDPGAQFAALYGWGAATLDSNTLLARVADLLWATGLPADYAGLEAPGIDGVLALTWLLGAAAGSAQLGLRGQHLVADGNRPPGIALVPVGSATIGHQADLGDGWRLAMSLRAGASSGYQLTIRPRGGIQLRPEPAQPAVNWTLAAELALAKSSAAVRTLLVGSPSATRFEAASAGLRGYAEATPTSGDVGLELLVKDGRLVVMAADGDGFLAQILPSDGLAVDVDFTLGWSSAKGVYFGGSTGLEATLRVDADLFGLLKIDSLFLALRASGDGLRSEVATTVAVQLGPVKAVVERFGLAATLTFPPAGGNLGPVDVALAFKPPSGAALEIDAGVVVGGGYLFFDLDKEQYAGAVQLELAKTLNLTAFGLLTTRMPDGSPGFSLLVLIAATFSPPVQLGYGFTLSGVGGLVGVNRTIAVEPLRAGLRTGSLGSVLFPQDPVATPRRSSATCRRSSRRPRDASSSARWSSSAGARRRC